MELRPVLVAGEVAVRPGVDDDVARLRAILAEPSVVRWWGQPPPVAEIRGDLLGDTGTVLLVVTVAGEVAGGIQYSEENDPRYRHAGIDVFLGGRFQDRGVGTTAILLLARFLVGPRGHHRLTIDPAADNCRAIRCYEKVGFRRVGVLRQYEIGPAGTPHDGLLMDLLRDELPITPGPAVG
ncbi:GNAT family N-acetyltransferase [Frankia sp. AgB32]|uniref:GNAT family N-acetyltransferase n=1 Tax=Frankia sp. AgB32 TaxID=631119 RepID=UPI00200E4AEF|nr:GNAT family protein [Frankia sp. AgB32]MCK9893680.1 GNAT family N-acetyltransferase [Frankia sp. AgB32]